MRWETRGTGCDMRVHASTVACDRGRSGRLPVRPAAGAPCRTLFPSVARAACVPARPDTVRQCSRAGWCGCRRALAQLVEHRSPKPAVGGSSPSVPCESGPRERAACLKRTARLRMDTTDQVRTVTIDTTRRDRRHRARVARRKKPTASPARISLFYRQVVAELRKVIWPTRKELVTYTTVVLVFVARGDRLRRRARLRLRQGRPRGLRLSLIPTPPAHPTAPTSRNDAGSEESPCPRPSAHRRAPSRPRATPPRPPAPPSRRRRRGDATPTPTTTPSADGSSSRRRGAEPTADEAEADGRRRRRAAAETLTSRPRSTRSRSSRGAAPRPRRVVRHPLLRRLREPGEDQPREPHRLAQHGGLHLPGRGPHARSQSRSRAASQDWSSSTCSPATCWSGWSSPTSPGPPCATPRA